MVFGFQFIFLSYRWLFIYLTNEWSVSCIGKRFYRSLKCFVNFIDGLKDLILSTVYILKLFSNVMLSNLFKNFNVKIILVMNMLLNFNDTWCFIVGNRNFLACGADPQTHQKYTYGLYLVKTISFRNFLFAFSISPTWYGKWEI